MPREKRSSVIIEQEVGIYHVTSRCVRKGFLCGYNKDRKKDFSYRREWIQERIRFLASIFLIDILGFGILSNHFHQIVRNRPDLAKSLSDREIALRMWRLLNETDTTDTSKRRNRKRQLKRKARQIEAMAADPELIAEYRRRLSSISHFMQYLNHRIACRANHEDRVSGRFWEGPFRCDRLETQDELLAAMVYVDLNPIRAGMADTPEESEYTSVYCRVHSIRVRNARDNDVDLPDIHQRMDDFLSPIDESAEPTTNRQPGSSANAPACDAKTPSDLDTTTNTVLCGVRASEKGCLPMSEVGYLAIVDCLGRQDRLGKRGKIPPNLSSIFRRLGLGDAKKWFQHYQRFSKRIARMYLRPSNHPDELRSWSMPTAVDNSKLMHSFL